MNLYWFYPWTRKHYEPMTEGLPMSTPPDRKPCGCLKTIACTHLDQSRNEAIMADAAEGFVSDHFSRSPPEVERTLAERGSRYGDFRDNAWLSQRLEDTVRITAGYQNLDPLHREALKFIFQKISRIINGDPNYGDNWHDIQGYAKLVEDRLPKEPK